MIHMLTNVDSSPSHNILFIKNSTTSSQILELEENEINDIAKLITAEHMSWEEHVWVLANLSLRVGQALILTDQYCWERLPSLVVLSKSSFARPPSLRKIDHVADQIIMANPSIEELRYCLAQRLYLAHLLASEYTSSK